MSIVLEEALKLPSLERLRIAEALFDSVEQDPEAVSFTSEQIAEFQRRVDFGRENPEKLIPWEVVQEKWRNRA